MAYSERQNNLFAAEDWKVAYKVFTNIDFTSSDYQLNEPYIVINKLIYVRIFPLRFPPNGTYK